MANKLPEIKKVGSIIEVDGKLYFTGWWVDYTGCPDFNPTADLVFGRTIDELRAMIQEKAGSDGLHNK